MPRSPRRLRPIVLLSLFVLLFTTAAVPAAAAPAKPAGPPTTGCQLQSANGAIQHVIYVQFDNVHYLRDNPNVPSDVEQMPNLLNFIKDNGTLLTNDHTILISHTGGGILSSLTGLYPDRHGQAVSNSYNFFRPDGTSRFLLDVQVLDRQHRRREPGEQPPDAVGGPELQHGQRRPGLPGRDRRGPQRARAVGARTPAPAATSATSAWRTPCSRTTPPSRSGRPRRPTSLAAAAVGWRHEHQGQQRQRSRRWPDPRDRERHCEPRTRDDRDRRHAPARPARASTSPHRWRRPTRAAARSTSTAPDPTGDMTKVFGVGSAEWNEGRESQIAPSGTAARALAQTDFVGIAIHCADPARADGICTDNSEREARRRSPTRRAATPATGRSSARST